jgi:hypothetical protein
MAPHFWHDFFPEAQLHNIIVDRSDHYPILLKLCVENRRQIMKEFKFENAWLLEEGFDAVVNDVWGKKIHSDILQKLNNCTKEMITWGRKLRSRYRDEIEECRKELEMMRSNTMLAQSNKYDEVRSKMSRLLAQEEDFWQQRLKIYWLRDGDTNSRFFHVMASSKRRRNDILEIQNKDGAMINTQQGIF